MILTKALSSNGCKYLSALQGLPHQLVTKQNMSENTLRPKYELSAHGYRNQRVALLTQHGKEVVIAPVLVELLGCRIKKVNGFDTDLLGTFTRDIAREGSQLDAARKKARIGMKLSGLPIGSAFNNTLFRRLPA